MRVLSKEEFEQEKDIIKNKLLEENIVFIYPTDTIYGIGCNAQNKEAVERIRKIKEREDAPFSVIAPSIDWIKENCVAKWLDKLPGPYTLIFKKKKACVAENVCKDTLGVRIPDHWFSKFVSEVGVPIVSTSVNKSQEDFMTSMDDLDPDIKSKVDFIIFEGEIRSKPSKVVNLTNGAEIVQR